MGHSDKGDADDDAMSEDRMLPDLESMDVIQGYEFVTFQPKVVPSPTKYLSSPSGERHTKPPTITNYVMDEETVRKILADFVRKNRLFSKAAAKHCSIDSIEATCGYQYKLRTYCERREVVWAFEPYAGTHTVILGPSAGQAPSVWNVDFAHGIVDYRDGTAETEIPYTASIHTCHVCDGERGESCPQHGCNEGKVLCNYCHGSHMSNRPEDRECHDDHVHCAACSCYGWTLCPSCHGFGKFKCNVCDAKGQLKWYMKLVLNMENHKSEDFVDKSEGWHTHELPDEAGMEGKGEVIFEEQGPRVWPIQDFPDPEVAELSSLKIHKHENQYSDTLIHCQYQTVAITPVTRVICTFKEQERHFYIFGKEPKVHFPDYWSKINCCTIS